MDNAFIGEFADHDKAQGDAIDHSVATGEPLFVTQDFNAAEPTPLPNLPYAEAVGGGFPVPRRLTEGLPIAENSELAQQAENAINPPKKLTQKEIKALFRAYFTVRRDRVKSCGHKFDMARDPRTGCISCWWAYFANNGSMTQTADECFAKEGKEMLERIRGKRFVKYFTRFMSSILKFKEEQKLQGLDGKSNITGGSYIQSTDANKTSGSDLA